MLVRIDHLLNDELLADICGKLANAQFEDGRATAGMDARPVKNNRQLPPLSALATELSEVVLKRVSTVPEMVGATFPHRISKPMFSCYETGIEHGAHVDNALMTMPGGVLRSDIAVTIFLSPPESYDGGELLIEDTGVGHHHVKLPAGSAFVYPATSLHRVAPVTRGRRLACVLWIQSRVRDPGQRRILVDLDMAAGKLRERDPSAQELKLVSAAYHNLMRLWADV
jgi:PKHD-type hydroxylase